MRSAATEVGLTTVHAPLALACAAFVSLINNDSPVHLVWKLKKFALDKNAEKITSVSLIKYLAEFGLIKYFNFLQQIFMQFC